MQFNIALSPEYSRSLGHGTVFVLLLIELSGLVLDGGLTAQITLMAVLGYLGGVTVLVVRRPQAPTATDLWLLRWGFVPLWLAVQVGTRYAWTWMGRL
jgi:hypothetical protein